jgi:hypothetical protein
VYEDPAVAALAREAVLRLQPIVTISLRREQVPFRLAEADEHAVADDEAVGKVRVLVPGGDVGLPPGEVVPVEERGHVVGHYRRRGGLGENDGGGEGDEGDQQ